MTAVYSILHMLVDGICALVMFGNPVSTEKGQISFLLYNFCAFALQMPLGVLQDMLNLWYKEKQKEFSLCFAILGVGVTIFGAVTEPVILGIGNALFHVGGGVGTIREDEKNGWKGRGLGVFVAPGALGLYIGRLIAKNGLWLNGMIPAGCLAVIFSVWAMVLHRRSATVNRISEVMQRETGRISKGCVLLGMSCFLVVILRSYIGMAVTFPWKQIPLWGLLGVLSVVCGKVAGGFLAVRLGYRRTTILTLGIAAVGYYGLQVPGLGVMALFAFNMTMPMTLYLLIKALPGLPGFSFGLLTFGLFLGFVPVYLGWQIGAEGTVLGSVGSILSMVILLFGVWQGGKHEYVSD